MVEVGEVIAPVEGVGKIGIELGKSVLELRSKWGLEEEPDFITTHKECKTKAKELFLEYKNRKEEEAKGREGYIDSNLREHEERIKRRENAKTRGMPELVVRGIWGIKGVENTKAYFDSVSESGVLVSSPWLREEVCVGISSFSPAELAIGIKRAKYFCESEFDPKLLTSDEGRDFLRNLVDMNDGDFQQLVGDLNKYHFIRTYMYVNYEEDGLSEDMRVFAEMAEVGGLGEFKKSLDEYEELAVLTFYDKRGRSDVPWSDGKSGYKPGSYEVKQNISEIIGRYPGEEFVDQVRRGIEAQMTWRLRNDEFDVHEMIPNSSGFMELASWKALEKFLEVAESDYPAPDFWQGSFNMENYYGFDVPKYLEGISVLGELIKSEEDLAWFATIEELIGERFDLINTDDEKQFIENLLGQRENFTSYLNFISSLPVFEEVDGLDLSEVIDVGWSGEIVINHRLVNKYLKAVETYTKDAFQSKSGLVSQEDYDYISECKKCYGTIYSSEYRQLPEIRDDYVFLGFLSEIKDDTREYFVLDSMGNSPVPESRLVEELLARNDIGDEVVQFWFGKNDDISSEAFMCYRGRLLPEYQRDYIRMHGREFLEYEHIPDDEREYWELVVKLVEDKYLSELSLLLLKGPVDAYLNGDGKLKGELFEEVFASTETGSDLSEVLRVIRAGELEIDLSEKQREFFGFLARSIWNWNSQETLSYAKFWRENRSSFGDLVQYGIPTIKYFEAMISEERVRGVAVDSINEHLDKLLSPEFLGRMESEDKKFWGFWKGKPRLAQAILALERSEKHEAFDLGQYRTDEGFPTMKLIEDMIKYPGKLDQVLVLVGEEGVLEFLPEKEKKYWELVEDFFDNGHPENRFIAKLIAKRRDVDVLIGEDGKPTHEFFEYVVKHSFSDELAKLLSDEIIDGFPEEDRKFWRFTLDKTGAVRDFLRKSDVRGRIEEIVDDKLRIVPEFVNLVVQELDGDNARMVLSSVFPYYLKSIPRSEIDTSVIDAVFENRGVVPRGSIEEVDVALSLYPEWGEKLKALTQESIEKQWADVITNPKEFWHDNMSYLFYLKHAGVEIDELSFSRFRSLVTNPEVRAVLFNGDARVSPISFADLRRVREDIKLKPDNWFYVSSGSLSHIASKLDNHAESTFYARLLAQKPRSFNNTIGAVRALGGDIDLEDIHVQESIFEALDEIGTVTPMVLRNYVLESDVEKRRQFVERMKVFQDKVYGNLPVRDIFRDYPDGDNVLAEMIAMSYPGVNVDQVRKEMDFVGDRCDDLEGLEFTQDGYDAEISSIAKIAVLQEGKELKRELLGKLREVFPRRLSAEDRMRYSRDMREHLGTFVSRVGAIEKEEVWDSVASILSILYEDEVVIDFRKTNFDMSSDENVSVFLGRAGELLGIYFKDNFESRLAESLVENPELHTDLSRRLKSAKKVRQYRHNFSKSLKGDDALLFEGDLVIVEEMFESDSDVPADVLARLVRITVEERFLKGTAKNPGFRTLIKREQKKFRYEDAEGELASGEEVKFSGYVSKNFASYFAKTTAGLCTSGDSVLFNRPEHFHINLVSPEKLCVGNIQGYMVEYEGRKSLLFRGFNPSASMVNQGNAGQWCEGMVSVIRQLVEDNEDISMGDIFVTDQHDVWHALTNRTSHGILEWFKKKGILSIDRKVEYSYGITRGITVEDIYPLFPDLAENNIV